MAFPTNKHDVHVKELTTLPRRVGPSIMCCHLDLYNPRFTKLQITDFRCVVSHSKDSIALGFILSSYYQCTPDTSKRGKYIQLSYHFEKPWITAVRASFGTSFGYGFVKLYEYCL